MGNVGGSRHYVGGGLGPIPNWTCPSCGAENIGTLALGCTHCGSGAPGRHVGTQPPTPPKPARVSEREPDDPTYQTPREQPAEAPPVHPAAEGWIVEHPEATMEDAWTAGWMEGVRQMRAEVAKRPAAPPLAFSAEAIVSRTIAAALELFRDQVLTHNPTEVLSGEWLNAHQATGLIAEMRGEEVVRG